ncbi:hypothetical protein QFZ37_002130 [Chryseobacterium ginsenosidimutans]|uniref:hypothetical protein n=1 Tax=Chryseobacterium ginsenosidimutans TaxID=687846 RepID=UPI00278B2B40|nr:hypothetical protein [Chryseobacterium ginsenosidimutans]MDQ0593761.1 hypothetical protein [Chryseobacterium ginsenosidimutans]
MDTKTIFLDACNVIAAQLDGFEIYKKGQRLKKNSPDKDMFFEITFESSYMNAPSHIMITPNIAIYSKDLKKWQIEHTKNEFSNGLIYGSHLGYTTPHNTWKKWNVAGLSFERSVNEIAGNIQKYVLPIFELFNSKENAIEVLKNNGTKFNKYAEDSLGPIDFLLCCSDKETSEIFFNNFIKNSGHNKKIVSFYEKLKTEQEIDLNYSEFVDARHLKLAFMNNLSIDNH